MIKGVTVGIPVFNDAEFVEQAIRSAVNQCELLVVADNCSNDKTEEVCRRLAAEYPHVMYVRHPVNKGAAFNFKYVLDCAETEYFMWLGAHDYIPNDYILRLKAVLQESLDSPLVFAKAQHVDRSGKAGGCVEYFFSEDLADDRPEKRLLAVIKYLSDCTIVHGLFRTGCLRGAWGDRKFDFLASDHVLVARMAMYGKLLYVPQSMYFRRDVHDIPSAKKQLERIVGKPVVEPALLIKRQMQVEQSELMRLLVSRNGSSNRWRFLAWVALIRRYGGYARSPISRCLETLLGRGLNFLGKILARARGFLATVSLR